MRMCIYIQIYKYGERAICNMCACVCVYVCACICVCVYIYTYIGTVGNSFSTTQALLLAFSARTVL